MVATFYDLRAAIAAHDALAAPCPPQPPGMAPAPPPAPRSVRFVPLESCSDEAAVGILAVEVTGVYVRGWVCVGWVRWVGGRGLANGKLHVAPSVARLRPGTAACWAATAAHEGYLGSAAQHSTQQCYRWGATVGRQLDVLLQCWLSETLSLPPCICRG